MYTIYAKGKLTMEHCRKADATVSSGMIEAVDRELVTFHSLRKADIEAAQEFCRECGFEVLPEVYKEIITGSYCEEVVV